MCDKELHLDTANDIIYCIVCDILGKEVESLPDNDKIERFIEDSKKKLISAFGVRRRLNDYILRKLKEYGRGAEYFLGYKRLSYSWLLGISWRYWVCFRRGKLWMIRDQVYGQYSLDGKEWFRDALNPWTTEDLVYTGYVPLVGNRWDWLPSGDEDE